MTTDNHNLTPVRVARNEDVLSLASLVSQLIAYERSLNETTSELTAGAASAHEIRKQMQRPNIRYFVAEREDEIVGYIKVSIHGRRFSVNQIGTLQGLLDYIENIARGIFNFIFQRSRSRGEAVGGYIAGVFVRSDARRAMVGRSLVRAAEDWLRAQGIASSELHVLYSNEDARRFWEKLGYKPLTMGMRKKLPNPSLQRKYE